LFGLKKSARIKIYLQKDEFLIIFKNNINYLEFDIENIELAIDKIE